jgi:hypothetical protein
LKIWILNASSRRAARGRAAMIRWNVGWISGWKLVVSWWMVFPGLVLGVVVE